MIGHTMLRSETYRDELADVAADAHDETGPQPTVQEIESVLADLDAPLPRRIWAMSEFRVVGSETDEG